MTRNAGVTVKWLWFARQVAYTPLIGMTELLDCLALYEVVLFIGIIGVEIATLGRKLYPYLCLCGFSFCIA